MSMQLVVFAIDREEYGFEISGVNGILRAKKFTITSMPGTSKTIEGMINVRGKINYLLNLRQKFSLVQKGISEESKFIMFNDVRANLGCIVDEVTDIVKIEEDNLQSAPIFLNNANMKFVSCIGKIDDRIIIILDTESILAADEYYPIDKSG